MLVLPRRAANIAPRRNLLRRWRAPLRTVPDWRTPTTLLKRLAHFQQLVHGGGGGIGSVQLYQCFRFDIVGCGIKLQRLLGRATAFVLRNLLHILFTICEHTNNQTRQREHQLCALYLESGVGFIIVTAATDLGERYWQPWCGGWIWFVGCRGIVGTSTSANY